MVSLVECFLNVFGRNVFFDLTFSKCFLNVIGRNGLQMFSSEEMFSKYSLFRNLLFGIMF